MFHQGRIQDERGFGIDERQALSTTFASPRMLILPQAADFFWLGRVPCRTVLLVGLVVGVQVYERRICYTCVFLPPYRFPYSRLTLR